MCFYFQKCGVFAQTVHLISAKIWFLLSALCDILATAFLSKSPTNIVLRECLNLNFLYPIWLANECLHAVVGLSSAVLPETESVPKY